MRGLRFLTLGLLVSLTVLAVRPAKANILLEPYLGYELGKFSYATTPSSTSYDFSSAVLGARVGYQFAMVFVAADYDLLLGGNLKNGTNGAPDSTVKGSQLFADVGVSLPLIRAYAGYGFVNSLTATANSFDTTSDGGSAFKLGVGTTILPLVAFNLEYIHTDYDKVTNSTVKSSSNVYMLNVSLPFNL
jgi:hypothetical protein